MARRRRRRPAASSSWDEVEALDESDDAPSAAEEAAAALDTHCLSHPTRPVTTACDGCREAICAMCAVPHRAEVLCPRCFTARLESGALTPGSAHGWIAATLGLVGVGVVLAPFTLLASAGIGGPLFGYGAAALGAAAIWFGFSAQDFRGLGRRAGWVGVALGVGVALATIALNLLGHLSRA